MCSSVRNLGLATQRAELLVPPGRRACAERLGEGAVLCHARVDRLAVIEVVGQRCVHVAERKVELGSDFIRALSEPFVPNRDVLHGDATTTDARLASHSARRQLDVVVQRFARDRPILARELPAADRAPLMAVLFVGSQPGPKRPATELLAREWFR
jgi:hypothetical protein